MYEHMPCFVIVCPSTRRLRPVFPAGYLVSIRKRKRFNQQEVAQRGRLTAGTISKPEEGKSSSTRASTVCKLAEAHGSSSDTLVSERADLGPSGARA